MQFNMRHGSFGIISHVTPAVLITHLLSKYESILRLVTIATQRDETRIFHSFYINRFHPGCGPPSQTDRGGFIFRIGTSTPEKGCTLVKVLGARQRDVTPPPRR